MNSRDSQIPLKAIHEFLRDVMDPTWKPSTLSQQTYPFSSYTSDHNHWNKAIQQGHLCLSFLMSLLQEKGIAETNSHYQHLLQHLYFLVSSNLNTPLAFSDLKKSIQRKISCHNYFSSTHSSQQKQFQNRMRYVSQSYYRKRNTDLPSFSL